MEQFSHQVSWQNYFAVEMAQADIEEVEAEAAVKIEEAKVMLQGGKLNDARTARDNDPRVAKLRREYRDARARRKLLQVAFENRDRCVSLLSRELTRRVGREGLQRRVDRLTP
jgi:hypothetical protein